MAGSRLPPINRVTWRFSSWRARRRMVLSAPLRRLTRLNGHQFLTHGFPKGRQEAFPAQGRLGADSGPDWVSMEASSPAGWPVVGGFSGGPVWDQDAGAVVGIVVMHDEYRTGHLLPVSYLAECWPPLGQMIRWRLDLDSNEDRKQWEGRARGVAQPSVSGWYFTGRVAALRELVSYITGQDPSDYRPRVVTGGPGAGKSAVLARLVTFADPDCRRAVPSAALDGALDGTIPPVGSVDAAVYAAGKTTEDVSRQLAEAFDLGAVGADKLPYRLIELGRPGVIVVDALDKAGDPRGLVKFLRKLADAGIRLILGTRKNLLNVLQEGVLPKQRRTIDLDVPEFLGPDDIRDYVTRVLLSTGNGTGHAIGGVRSRSPSPYRDKPALAAQVAAAVARAAGSNFLIAQLHAFALAGEDEPVDVTKAGWFDEFANSADAAMSDFIDRVAESPYVRDSLADKRTSKETCRQWIVDMLTGWLSPKAMGSTTACGPRRQPHSARTPTPPAMSNCSSPQRRPRWFGGPKVPRARSGFCTIAPSRNTYGTPPNPQEVIRPGWSRKPC